MLNKRGLRAPLVVALMGAVPAVPGAFVLTGILGGAGNTGMLADLVNPRYFQMPLPITLHIASGILFCALAPLQFSARLRARAPQWHRLGGRLAVVVGMMFGLSALPALGPAPEGAGWLRYGGLFAGAIGFNAALMLAFIAIRCGNIRAHHAWALRMVAIGLMGASRVLIEALAWLVLGDVTEITGGAVIWLAMVLNLMIVELHLRRRRPRRRPMTN